MNWGKKNVPGRKKARNEERKGYKKERKMEEENKKELKTKQKKDKAAEEPWTLHTETQTKTTFKRQIRLSTRT